MTNRTTMPHDASGGFVQVLRPLAGGAHHVSFDATQRNSSAFDAATRSIEIFATEDCYFQTGDGSITATSADHFLPADVSRVYAVGGDKQIQHSHIAVVKDTTAGVLHVSELE